MAWRVRADPLRFEEAEAFLTEKVPLTQAEYRALSLQAAQRAFTVAGVAQLDLINETLGSLQRAVEDGTPFKDWAKTIGPQLGAAWGGPKPWRLELIFRQNVLGAYAAGRYAQQTDPQVQAARPYWMYDAVLDSGTTPICQGLNGFIQRADDPIWERIYPPNHFGCRSGVRSLTTREAEAKGGVSKLPPGLEVPPGFARPPTASWEPDPSKYDPELWAALQGKLPERIEIGREIAELRGDLSRVQRRALLRGIEGLRINRWLRENPIAGLEALPRLQDAPQGTLGDFDPTSRWIRVTYPRASTTWDSDQKIGELQSISFAGRTQLEAAAITLVHELSHHIYNTLREDLENRVFAQYLEAKKQRHLVSRRAGVNVLEWFSETVSAYRYLRRELRRFDPESFAIIDEVIKSLR